MLQVSERPLNLTYKVALKRLLPVASLSLERGCWLAVLLGRASAPGTVICGAARVSHPISPQPSLRRYQRTHVHTHTRTRSTPANPCEESFGCPQTDACWPLILGIRMGIGAQILILLLRFLLQRYAKLWK